MMTISPYLTFNGNCREAMTFYRECLGGELRFQTVAETPMADQCPAGMQDQIMHSSLTHNSAVLMATDMTPPEGFRAGTDMAVSLGFDSKEAIDRCYTALSAGGNVLHPLKTAFGEMLFGVVQDKFGKVWMMNYPADPSQ